MTMKESGSRDADERVPKRSPFGTEGAMRELQHKKSDRAGSKKQIQVKFEVQIYKVRDGEYCIDIQVQGHPAKPKAIFLTAYSFVASQRLSCICFFRNWRIW